MNQLLDALYRYGTKQGRRPARPDPVLAAIAVAVIVLVVGIAVGLSWLLSANPEPAISTPVPTLPRPVPTALFIYVPEPEPPAGPGAIYLPAIARLAAAPRRPTGLEQPIWATGQAGAPAAVGRLQGSGTVALFRRTFDLSATMLDAELSIVADTRYEVWLDGAWLGRGPARFSRARQEYDVLDLGGLPAGEHTLAVLVQFAPNFRRSESSQPALHLVLHGWDGSTWQKLVVTDESWRAMVSPAWDAAAALVSPLGLIGPMEVLDLRQLPAGWIEPGFDDSAWPFAWPVSPSPFPALSARTIPLLRQDPVLPQAALESGLLSAGYRLVELEPAGTGAVTATLVVTVMLPSVLRVEALDGAPLVVDGSQSLAWTSLADARRPDVLAAELSLPAGRHTLAVSVPGESACPPGAMLGSTTARLSGQVACTLPGGRTLAIRTAGLLLPTDTGVRPVHDPGRRVLLANPEPGGPGAPLVELLPGGADISIPAGDTPRYVVLDFGRTLHARLSLVADGPAGTVLDAGWDERLTEGRPLPNPGSLASYLWSQVDSWVLDGESRHLTTLDARSGRYLLLQVFGPGPVTLRQVKALEEVYPANQVGEFASSDPLLDRIWQTGADTLRPNMTDAYTDTPWRERGQWWADALISFHANRAAYGDLALFRRGLRQMADAIAAGGHPDPLAPNGAGLTMLDFGMQWLEGLHLYWQLSGDLELVEELYPAAGRLAGFLAAYEGSAGLLDVPPGDWPQTALVDWPAVTSRTGESTALNAQYAAVLRQLGDMAEALGDPAAAEAYRGRATAVQAALNAILFVPHEGCYAASRLDGALLPCSIHAQAWALRYGAPGVDRQAAVTEWLVSSLDPFFDGQGRPVVEPPGMFYVLEALAGQPPTGTDKGLALVREAYGDLLDRGASTWWELYSYEQHRGHSLSHAWGSSPTWFLSAYVLGAVSAGPGASAWRVAPRPGDLAYAQGAVPLGSDLLEVSWRRPACGQFELDMTTPTTSAGEILLPVWRHDARVTLDGALIWDDGQVGTLPVAMTPDGILISQLLGGHHHISATSTCSRVLVPLIPLEN